MSSNDAIVSGAGQLLLPTHPFFLSFPPSFSLTLSKPSAPLVEWSTPPTPFHPFPFFALASFSQAARSW
jgi:hypothetical protein